MSSSAGGPRPRRGGRFRRCCWRCVRASNIVMPGRVGSGYSGAGLETLSKQFKALARKTPPVKDVPPRHCPACEFHRAEARAPRSPFRGWTRDGLVRQGSFKGLRSDKPANRDREGDADADTQGCQSGALAAVTSAKKDGEQDRNKNGKRAEKDSNAAQDCSFVGERWRGRDRRRSRHPSR